MTIDIVIGDNPDSHENNHHLKLEDDGYYEYLSPLFAKIGKHTGSYIDQYKDCHFSLESQSILRKYLQEEFHNISKIKTKAISFSAGKYLERDKKKNIMIEKEKIYNIHKQKLIEILTNFIKLIDIAQEKQLDLFCIGD